MYLFGLFSNHNIYAKTRTPRSVSYVYIRRSLCIYVCISLCCEPQIVVRNTCKYIFIYLYIYVCIYSMYICICMLYMWHVLYYVGGFRVMCQLLFLTSLSLSLSFSICILSWSIFQSCKSFSFHSLGYAWCCRCRDLGFNSGLRFGLI